MPRAGLYVITPDRLAHDTRLLARAVAGALAGGARLVQYRDKTPDGPGQGARRLANAQALVALCHAAGVPLIVNDDLDLALASRAAGVHLGLADGSLAAARRRLGPRALLGATCHDSLARARAAVAEGADYVAFGAVYPSPSKPAAPRVALSVLAEAARELPVPVCAIGGLTAANAGPVVAAGAGLVAVIDAVFGGCTPDAPTRPARTAARAFSDLWPRPVPARDEDTR